MGTYVQSVDGNCTPSDAQACRFIVHNLFLRLGAFSIENAHVAEVTAQAEGAFQVTLGGGKPLTAAIPSYVRFLGVMRGNFGRLAFFPSSRQLRVTINPAGDGLFVLSGALTGRMADHDFSIGVSITADTPLTNRMPLPNAGPDQTVTSTTCEAVVTLDGAASSDPDGNLTELRWVQDDVTVGLGANVSTNIRKSGIHLIRLVARDASFGAAADDVQVSVQLAAGCP